MRNLRGILKSRGLWKVAAAVNIGLAIGSLALWGVAYTQQLSWRADFTQLYTGATLVISGRRHELYDFAVQTQVQQQLLRGRHLASGLLPFNYPPHVAVLLAPLALVSLDRAYLIWSGLQLGLLVWLWHVLSRHIRSEGVGDTGRAVAISAVLALPAVGATLVLGALSTLMLVSLLNFAFALRRDDDRCAGLWLLFLTLKPQIAVVPALMFLAARRWKAIVFSLACGLVVLAVVSLALGPAVWTDFVDAIFMTLGADGDLGVAPAKMHNLRSLLTFLLGEGSVDLVDTISLFAFVASLAIVFWLWSKRQARALDIDMRLALTRLISLLFSPHVNPQDGVLLVVPALFFWHYLRRSGRRHRLFGALAGICPATLWVTERGLSAAWASAVPALVMVLLGVWMICVCSANGTLGSSVTNPLSHTAQAGK